MVAVTALTVVVAVIREGDLAKVVRLRRMERADGERLRGELDWLARACSWPCSPTRSP